MKPILALTGPNETFKREHLNRVLSGIPKEDVTVYFADETDAPVIFSQCSQTSLFGSHSVVVVRNLDALTDKKRSDFDERLERYADNPNESCTLVLLAEKIPAGVLAKLDRAGETVEFRKAWRKDLTAYAGQKLRQAGIAFEPDVPDFVVTLANEDSEETAMMTGLLLSFGSEKKKIALSDAQALLSRSNTMTIFDLIEGLWTRNARKALSALADLRLAGEGLPRVSAMLLRSARLLWGFLSLKDKKDPAGELGIKPYEARKISEYARGTDLKFVSSVIAMVRRLETRTKTMADEFSWLELETFLAASARS